MVEPATPQRRRHLRVRKFNLVQVNRFNVESFRADLSTGRTLDISRGGIRLELHHPLPLRSVVDLTLALGDDLVEIRGRIVHLEKIDEDRCAIGIEFTDPSDASLDRLEAYIAESAPPPSP